MSFSRRAFLGVLACAPLAPKVVAAPPPEAAYTAGDLIASTATGPVVMGWDFSTSGGWGVIMRDGAIIAEIHDAEITFNEELRRAG